MYHLEKRKDHFDAKVEVLETGPLRAAIRIHCTLSSVSWIKQQVSLSYDSHRLEFDTEVEWHETHQFLKVE